MNEPPKMTELLQLRRGHNPHIYMYWAGPRCYLCDQEPDDSIYHWSKDEDRRDVQRWWDNMWTDYRRHQGENIPWGYGNTVSDKTA